MSCAARRPKGGRSPRGTQVPQKPRLFASPSENLLRRIVPGECPNFRTLGVLVVTVEVALGGRAEAAAPKPRHAALTLSRHEPRPRAGLSAPCHREIQPCPGTPLAHRAYLI